MSISHFLHLLKILRVILWNMVLWPKTKILSLLLKVFNDIWNGSKDEEYSQNNRKKWLCLYILFIAIQFVDKFYQKSWPFTWIKFFHLETGYYFLLHYFNQYKKSVGPPISRIGLICAINTMIVISVALHKYDFIQIGPIGTHPLEKYFCSLRE